MRPGQLHTRGHPMLQVAIKVLQRFDFSFAQAALVSSVPGRQAGNALWKYGVCILISLPDVFTVDLHMYTQ